MRSAWIEIVPAQGKSPFSPSRSMRSAWIEIAGGGLAGGGPAGRAPCGARGLKFEKKADMETKQESRSMRSAWIEISHVAKVPNEILVALHAERVD